MSETAGVETDLAAAVDPGFLRLVTGLSEPAQRGGASRALAARLGGRELIVLVRDREVGALLPARGFRQTLRGTAQWRELLDRAVREGECRGELSGSRSGAVVPVIAVASGGEAVAVVLDATKRSGELDALRTMLPLLAAVLRAEREASTAAGHRKLADRAAALAQALDGTRARLQDALYQVEQARREAEHANRAKNDFLAIMSHELRTPLNAMIGYSDLLVAGVPQPVPPLALRQAERIGISARHLLGLIEEILTFSRLEAGEDRIEIADVSLPALIEDVAVMIEPLAAAKGLQYDCRMPGEPLPVRSDARKIRQILVNLLRNAVKFTESGSVRLVVETRGETAVFRVEDTGIGIEPADMDRIFEPFWQARSGVARAAVGTGLGLSLSRRLAHLLGGDVTATSQLGVGSTFTLRLPLHARRPRQNGG